MKKSELREIVKEIVEELCAKGKAYRKRRMAAGEKSSAYLSGRAVKVCKGQMQGENTIDEIEAADNTEFKIKLKHLLQKHATNLEKGSDDTEFELTLKHLLDKHVNKGGEKND